MRPSHGCITTLRYVWVVWMCSHDVTHEPFPSACTSSLLWVEHRIHLPNTAKAIVKIAESTTPLYHAFSRIISPMHAGLLTYGIEGIAQLMADAGQPKFRGMQIVEWVYRHGATDYDQMTNVPANLRQTLRHEYPLNIPRIRDLQVDPDGTRKYVLELHDGNLMETVAIPSSNVDSQGNPKRMTACISSQVGCAMECAFCATGTEGFTRNLLPGEIAQQVLCIHRDTGINVTNVVVMGQGEPFLNYGNLMDCLRIINHPKAIGIGARHITVSTCGIVAGINRFAQEPEQFTLAISLHAARQHVRDQLMPRCEGIHLDALKASIGSYYEGARRRVSLEYLLIEGVNDSSADLDALKAFCSGLHVHVNLLPLNKVSESPLRPASRSTFALWEQELSAFGVECTVRKSRGGTIAAACGQLKNQLS